MSTTLAVFLCLAALWLLTGAWEAGGRKRWLAAGAAIGVAGLAHPASLLLALRIRDRFRAIDLVALAALMALGIVTRPDVVVPCGVVAAFVVMTSRPEHRPQVVLVLGGARSDRHTQRRFGVVGSRNVLSKGTASQSLIANAQPDRSSVESR